MTVEINRAYKEWASAAFEIFKDAFNSGNIKLCESIYEDVLDAGHYKTAREMKSLLDNRK